MIMCFNRALRYVVDNSHVSIAKAFYEGFCLSFLTALDRSSHPIVVNLITQHIVGKKNLKLVLLSYSFNVCGL